MTPDASGERMFHRSGSDTRPVMAPDRLKRNSRETRWIDRSVTTSFFHVSSSRTSWNFRFCQSWDTHGYTKKDRTKLLLIGFPKAATSRRRPTGASLPLCSDKYSPHAWLGLKGIIPYPSTAVSCCFHGSLRLLLSMMAGPGSSSLLAHL